MIDDSLEVLYNRFKFVYNILKQLEKPNERLTQTKAWTYAVSRCYKGNETADAEVVRTPSARVFGDPNGKSVTGPGRRHPGGLLWIHDRLAGDSRNYHTGTAADSYSALGPDRSTGDHEGDPVIQPGNYPG